MTDQQTCLLAIPPRYHDVQQTKELVQKREVQSRLSLWRWCLRIAGCCVGHPSCARGLKKESAMGFKGCLFRRVYNDLGRRVAIRHVDCPGAIFVLQPRIPPQKSSACFSFRASVLVQPSGSIASAYDGEEQGDGRQQLGKLGCAPDAGLEELRIVIVEC